MKQLELPLAPRLKVIQGLGQKKKPESLASRDAVARVLIETGADLLLKRISPTRAEAIEEEVEAILVLFDRVDREPLLMPELQKKLDGLEELMRETRERRATRAR
ncbi:MAG: hypothetical protein IPJ65_16755 [Archangiaceae bacterium]|nr:hypothetical protein [Archangiaceae bacterium]